MENDHKPEGLETTGPHYIVFVLISNTYSLREHLLKINICLIFGDSGHEHKSSGSAVYAVCGFYTDLKL